MSQAETLRVAFKEGLSKLNEIDTRTHVDLLLFRD